MNAKQDGLSMDMQPCQTGVGIRAQFACPSGPLGWLVGHLMALKNRGRSLWVLSLLDVQPADRVLEIGFGSGADIRRASLSARQGFVAGVDHSKLMVDQASRRNARAIREGRVELRLGSGLRLPYPEGSFDKVFSINVAQFSSDAVAGMAEARRVLRAGGLAAIAVQPRWKGATEEDSNRMGLALTEAMRSAGFSEVRSEMLSLRPVSVACALGRKLAG
jgi:SAM-dependent methyltransferase